MSCQADVPENLRISQSEGNIVHFQVALGWWPMTHSGALPTRFTPLMPDHDVVRLDNRQDPWGSLVRPDDIRNGFSHNTASVLVRAGAGYRRLTTPRLLRG